MCDPLLAAGIALSAVSTFVGFAQQSANARAQERFQEERFRLTKEASDRAFLAEAAAMNLRIQEEAEAKSNRIQATNIQKAQAKASAKVSAGEAGVTGLSIEGLLADFERTADINNQITRQNFEFAKRQTELDKEGARANAKNRVVGVLPQPVPKPSLGAAVLGFAGDAFGQYRQFKVDQRKLPSTTKVSSNDFRIPSGQPQAF